MRCCSPASQRDTPSLLLRGRTEACRESSPAPPSCPRRSSFLRSPARYASDSRTKTITPAASRTVAPLQRSTSQVSLRFPSQPETTWAARIWTCSFRYVTKQLTLLWKKTQLTRKCSWHLCTLHHLPVSRLHHIDDEQVWACQLFAHTLSTVKRCARPTVKVQEVHASFKRSGST